MKIMRRLFVLLTCLSCTLWGDAPSPNWVISGSEEGWREEALALQYFHHSELQRQWAWHLLSHHAFSGDERVLDFGCGDGKITAEISHFVRNGEILGVDISPSLIKLAQSCFPKAYYRNLSFAAPSALQGCYDVICSFCVFHVVPNPVEILAQLREHIDDNGYLYLVVPCGRNDALFTAAEEMFERYHLSCPWRNPGSSPKEETMRTAAGCLNCLAKAGWGQIFFQENRTPTAFYNRNELIEWMIGTLAPNWQIPLDTSRAFFGDLVDRMSELDDEVIDDAGVYHMKISRFEVIAAPTRK